MAQSILTELIRRTHRFSCQEGRARRLTARRNADDEFVGWFCLSPDANAVAEIGYRLRQKVWGHGLASEGASALVSWGFEVAGYDKIVATTMAVNQGSRRVMEKIGMKHMRTDFLKFSDPIPALSTAR